MVGSLGVKARAWICDGGLGCELSVAGSGRLEVESGDCIFE